VLFKEMNGSLKNIFGSYYWLSCYAAQCNINLIVCCRLIIQRSVMLTADRLLLSRYTAQCNVNRWSSVVVSLYGAV
jgi:hypothetical protein